MAFEMDGNGNNAEKFYYLNKILNGVDIYYEVELPSIWWTEHPLGSVMGKAKYSNSKILGKTQIGNNVILSANSYVKDEIIPDNSVVFGMSPHLIIKTKTKEDIEEIYNNIWRII